MRRTKNVVVTVDSQYYRKQFDDWLSGGTVEYKDKTYYWSAEDVRYGWEIEPINEEHWEDLEEAERCQIVNFVMHCLHNHEVRYLGQIKVGGKSCDLRKRLPDG
jgi:hypothetical protein